MKITNISQGPRGLNTTVDKQLVPVLVEPGETVDVDLSDAEVKVAKATGWFKFGGKAEEPSTDKKD